MDPALAESTSPADRKPSLVQLLVPLLRDHREYRIFALLSCIALIPVSIGIVWFIWFRILPDVWTWSFAEWSLRSILGAFAVFFLAFTPPYAPFGAVVATLWVLRIYAEAETKKVTQILDRGSQEQAAVENELKASDSTGLVALVQYSRIQLEAYYRIGLSQTEGSFKYSVIAMWIGFGVIMLGIVIRVVDLQRFGLQPPDTDISTLVIMAGAIIEVISALFLWVYRNSIRQFTYFYNRQMHSHSVLVCQKIAETMAAPDDVRKMIIERVLDATWKAEQDSLPTGKALLSFGTKK